MDILDVVMGRAGGGGSTGGGGVLVVHVTWEPDSGTLDAKAGDIIAAMKAGKTVNIVEDDMEPSSPTNGDIVALYQILQVIYSQETGFTFSAAAVSGTEIYIYEFIAATLDDYPSAGA